MDTGFFMHISPRFKFRSRVDLQSVVDESESDLLIEEGLFKNDPRVFMSDVDGTNFRIKTLNKEPRVELLAEKFVDWLFSEPGKKAIAGFKHNGKPIFFPEVVAVEEEQLIVFSGNRNRGSQLANSHCERCHVVDRDRPFSGIDSTPSFHALRTIEDWQSRFTGFWLANPHRALITVSDLNQPDRKASPLSIAPIILNLKDIEDILAFAASIEPADLGAPVLFRK